MKTVSMWSYESGAREINIHDVEPEIFEKLRPAFDVTTGQSHAGYLFIDENTKIIFYKKQDDKKDETAEELEASDRVARLIRKG